MTGMTTVEKIAAISQLFADGLLEKAETMAITYMASMNITPAMARGRFHFMGTPRFLWDGTSLYYNRKLRKLKVRIWDLFTKTSDLQPVFFYQIIVKSERDNV